jgi:hypothetical protein
MNPSLVRLSRSAAFLRWRLAAIEILLAQNHASEAKAAALLVPVDTLAFWHTRETPQEWVARAFGTQYPIRQEQQAS